MASLRLVPTATSFSITKLLWWLPAIFVASVLVPFICKGIYNVYFHPLRRVPGPKWAAFNDVAYVAKLLRGDIVVEVDRLHKKYGPVVRVAPNEVSFANAESWKAIYGFKAGQKDGYEKDMHFFPPPINGTRSIVIAHGADHGRQRRIFSHAFSDKALRDQQPLIIKYVDLLIARLHKQANSEKKGLIDATAWYNFITFDVIADLTFGESFHCLDNSDYHPLVQLIYATMKAVTFLNAQKRFAWLKYLVKFYVSPLALQKRQDLTDFIFANVDRRLSMEAARPDFLTPVSGGNQTSSPLSLAEIQSTSVILIIAGSETTATTLTATTYLALSHPQVWKRMVEEVRGAFQSDLDMTIDKINANLPYMLAVLNEALRLYPPVPTGFGRVVPPGGDTISGYYVPEGTGVYVSQIAINHSLEYFVEPDKFLPERWLGGDKFKNDNPRAFNPFSQGPRNCLGKNLAYLEMRMVMARIIWNFDLDLCEAYPGEWLAKQKVFTLWDKPPLWLRLRPVQRDQKVEPFPDVKGHN